MNSTYLVRHIIGHTLSKNRRNQFGVDLLGIQILVFRVEEYGTRIRTNGVRERLPDHRETEDTSILQRENHTHESFCFLFFFGKTLSECENDKCENNDRVKKRFCVTFLCALSRKSIGLRPNSTAWPRNGMGDGIHGGYACNRHSIAIILAT